MKHFIAFCVAMIAGLIALFFCAGDVSETAQHVSFAISVACLLCGTYCFIQIVRETP